MCCRWSLKLEAVVAGVAAVAITFGDVDQFRQGVEVFDPCVRRQSWN